MGWYRNLLAKRRGYYYTSGGVHMEKHKERSHQAPLEDMPVPDEVVLFMRQHVGALVEPVVKIKDQVKIGQIVAESKAFVSSPVHATISGIVKKIESKICPTGDILPAITIKGDGKEDWVELKPLDPINVNKQEIIDRVKWAGIVGLGGAGFPAFIKLQPKEKVEHFIVNAAECEPYLGKDYRLLKEKTEDVLLGAELLARAMDVEKRYIALHADKLDVADKLKAEGSKYNFKVVVLPVKYPHGAEKVLIDAVIGRRVPPMQLPPSVGAMVFNVETCLMTTWAVRDGKPLIEKHFTVAGEGVWHTKNLKARIGQSVEEIVNFCGGLTQECRRVIFGGPMTGFAMPSLDTNIVKITSGIVALTEKAEDFGPCIHCGRCVETCDNNMNPSLISLYIEKGKYSPDLNPVVCVECGGCSYVCPEHRPLTQFIRVAKKLQREYEAKNK